MRHVFPNHEIPHLWAHQTQSDARGSNLFFEGPTIYSYGRHFPIACIHENKRGKLILFNSGRRSMTTAKHQGYVRRAIPRDWRTIHCPHVLGHGADVSAGRHGDNIEYFLRNMADAHEKAGRRMTERAVEWDANAAAGAHKDLADYLTFFAIRRKMPAMPSFADAFERARRIENPDPVKDAAKFRAREKRAAAADAVSEYRDAMVESMLAAGHSYPGYRVTEGGRWQKMLARMVGREGTPGYVRDARRTDWRLFGAFGCGSPGHDDAVMLRVNGEQIETSQGARVPLAAAPMVWSLYRRAVADGGRDFSKGLGERVKIGEYPLDRIDADGTLRAGCHVIPASELQAMARALGLA